MLDVIKAQCFKGNPQNITDAQLAAFVSIAADMGVNPLLPGMMYAFPIQGGGIVPMMGPDGVYKKLSEHPEVDSWETTVYPEDVSLPPTHATTLIFRKGHERPLKYTALLVEWRVQANPNWNTRTRHMLSLRSLKQCARQIIHGVPYDEDERVIMGEINITPPEAAAAPVERPAPPARAKKGVATVTEATKPADKPADKPASNIVEGDFDDVPKQPEVVVAKPQDRPVTMAAETPAPAAEVKPRAFLQDKEEIVAVCQVKDVNCLIANLKGVATPTVQANVTGQFTGTVLHFDGAVDREGTLGAAVAWKVGGTVKIGLRGQLNNKSGKVLNVVTSIEASPASPEVDIN